MKRVKLVKMWGNNMSNYQNIGVLLDMSRNGVMTVPQVKRYADSLRSNACTLYCDMCTRAISPCNI